jgi:hypothetical protein
VVASGFAAFLSAQWTDTPLGGPYPQRGPVWGSRAPRSPAST